ncbi:MAG TPA: hypothetical protein VGB01_07825 [candidate division Zixibacteria bacterium]|jgi:hypothetical protein
MRSLFILDPSWVAAIAAVIYAGFTLWLVIEMRRDRKLAHKPFVKAIYVTGKLPDTLLFNFKNVGKGPALNFKITSEENGEIKWRSKQILTIGSGEETSVPFDIKGKNI